MAKKKKILHTPSDPQKAPHRFLLRRGDAFYRIVDLQILDEPGDRLSLHIKPPLEHLYKSRKPTNKLAFKVGGLVNINLNNDITKGTSCFNPYASWHSSGKSHINGYSTKNLEREVVLNDSDAVSISDIAVPPHIIFTAAFPINGLSHVKVSPPPDDFDGNYIEVSNKPYHPNVTNKDTPVHYVIDMADMKPGSIVMDVMVHNRGVEMDIEKNHPYPHDSEMFFVAPPLKIAPNNSLCPAVTVFFYQPVNNNGQITIEKQPTTVWVRSRGAKADQFFQYEPF